jgi:hypothetical protein
VGLDAVNNAMDAVDAAAPIRNSNVPITPARVGYLTYTDWAEKVNQQFQTAIDKSLSVGDGGMAAYYKLMQMEHQEEVKKQKSNYRGL